MEGFAGTIGEVGAVVVVDLGEEGGCCCCCCGGEGETRVGGVVVVCWKDGLEERGEVVC